MTSSLASMTLIFLGGLDLRLIISRRGIIELSLVFDFIPVLSIDIIFLVFFDGQPVAFQAPEVDLFSLGG